MNFGKPYDGSAIKTDLGYDKKVEKRSKKSQSYDR